VVVGAGDIGQLVARKLLQHPEYGINLVGFVDDEGTGT
jgi:saccharopine dehydrogenase-like NADP-dependent oxidoreductase